MNAEKLIQLAATYAENKDFITNEETAKMALVVPFIRLLGYDLSQPREVRAEFSADFVQGDGKKLPDRMDFAIFDKAGVKPLIVIETKPPGTNLRAKSPQLARYIAQLPDLHFGIITDGCNYLFYGDIDSPNQMCAEPYFKFSLAEEKTDWAAVAAVLIKYSRDNFNAETLQIEAENTRYINAMIDKLLRVFRDPSVNEGFMKWLVEDIFDGRRTVAVMERMGELAKEAIEPALLRAMSDEFLETLHQRITAVNKVQPENDDCATDQADSLESDVSKEREKRESVTTEEELRFHELVSDICEEEGYDRSRILARDTLNYFNVSLDRPTKWFIRFFGDQKRKNIVTPLSVDQLRELAPGFEVEESPATFGASRIYIDDIAQTVALKQVVLRCVETLN